MTEAQAVEAISAAFVAAWTFTPLALDNEAAPIADTFAQLDIRHTTSPQMTLGPRGGRRVRRNGTIYVRLWGPLDAGRSALSGLCDSARAILEATDLVAGLHTLAASTREIGPDKGSTRWGTAVVVPFWYEATI